MQLLLKMERWGEIEESINDFGESVEKLFLFKKATRVKKAK